MAQGKIEAIADVDGLFKVDVDRLYAINSIGELTIVTRFNNTPVKAGDKLAGMRCIPLLLEEQQVEDARKLLMVSLCSRKAVRAQNNGYRYDWF
ncbi:MAG: hypothetical protein ACLRZ2_04635 [Veillonella sp.]